MDNLIHSLSGASASVIALTTFYPLDNIRTRLQVDEELRAEGTFISAYHILRREGISSLYTGWWPVTASLCASNLVYFYFYAKLRHHFQSNTPPYDLFCAFIAGCINVMLTAPLWVVNTRLRLQAARLETTDYHAEAAVRQQLYTGPLDCARDILRREGLRSFWQGTAASLVLVCNPALQFCVYEFLKRYAIAATPGGKANEVSGLIVFLMGAVAKTVATVATYPMQVVQTRVRAGFAEREKNAASLLHVLLIIVQSQGLKGLYRGMESKLLQTVLTAALMFLIYEKLLAVSSWLLTVQ